MIPFLFYGCRFYIKLFLTDWFFLLQLFSNLELKIIIYKPLILSGEMEKEMHIKSYNSSTKKKSGGFFV
jgi:hypothetical protein